MRSLSGDQIAALAARSVMIRTFIWCEALDLDGVTPAPVGFWNDLGTVTLDGRVYQGSGNVITVGPISAKSELSIPGLTITLNSIATEAAILVQGSMVAQRPITVYDGLFNPATKALIPPLIPIFVGFIDDVRRTTPAVGDTSTVELICESILRAMTVKRSDTRSPASFNDRYPEDKFYQYTANQREQQLYFGKQSTRNPAQTALETYIGSKK